MTLPGRPIGHRTSAGFGRVLGLGMANIGAGITGTPPVASTISQGLAQTADAPRVSGIMRLTWWVASVLSAPATSSPPRVWVRWSVQDEAARGNLVLPERGLVSDPASAGQGPFLVCDAWYGSIEIAATSAQIQAGFEPGDTASGNMIVEGTITEGGTGAEQYATYSRHLSIATPPGTETVLVPGATTLVNNGAHRARSITVFPDAAIDITVQGFDWSGTLVQTTRTGAPAAPTPAPLQETPLHPSVRSVTLLVGAPIANGFVTFRYF